MIIDIHVHQRLEAIDGSRETHLAALLASADRSGIDRLCLLGNVLRYGTDPSASEVRRINDDTMACVRLRPDRLTGFCFLNPANGPRSIDTEINRCIAAGPLRGVKLWISVNARDERLDPIMSRAAELGVPVLHHAWYKTVSKTPNESDPSDIAHLARRHPAATIIMAHLAGVGVRGVRDVADCPNVCIDTSGSQPVSDIVAYAVATIGAGRVLFGSDVPVRDFASQLGRVTGAGLRRRDRELILSGNARRLLKLDEGGRS